MHYGASAYTATYHRTNALAPENKRRRSRVDGTTVRLTYLLAPARSRSATPPLGGVGPDEDGGGSNASRSTGPQREGTATRVIELGRKRTTSPVDLHANHEVGGKGAEVITIRFHAIDR